MSKDTSGPAFPPAHDPKTHPSGMSLRDYFAAAVMQGMLASPGEALVDHLIEAYARQSYRIADAMLIARDQ